MSKCDYFQKPLSVNPFHLDFTKIVTSNREASRTVNPSTSILYIESRLVVSASSLFGCPSSLAEHPVPNLPVDLLKQVRNPRPKSTIVVSFFPRTPCLRSLNASAHPSSSHLTYRQPPLSSQSFKGQVWVVLPSSGSVFFLEDPEARSVTSLRCLGQSLGHPLVFIRLSLAAVLLVPVDPAPIRAILRIEQPSGTPLSLHRPPGSKPVFRKGPPVWRVWMWASLDRDNP